jgi:hypothetical protein
MPAWRDIAHGTLASPDGGHALPCCPIRQRGLGRDAGLPSGALFLLMRQWTPLAILLTVTAVLPIFDMAVLSQSGITPPVFHPLALVLLALAAVLLWRRAVMTSKEKS